MKLNHGDRSSIMANVIKMIASNASMYVWLESGDLNITEYEGSHDTWYTHKILKYIFLRL